MLAFLHKPFIVAVSRWVVWELVGYKRSQMPITIQVIILLPVPRIVGLYGEWIWPFAGVVTSDASPVSAAVDVILRIRPAWSYRYTFIQQYCPPWFLNFTLRTAFQDTYTAWVFDIRWVTQVGIHRICTSRPSSLPGCQLRTAPNGA